MNKVTPLEFRRDIDAIEWARELRETEAWFQSERFSEITGGTGIRVQGNFLYAATVTDVYRIALKPGELVPSAAPELVIGGMPGTTFNNRMVVPDGRG